MYLASIKKMNHWILHSYLCYMIKPSGMKGYSYSLQEMTQYYINHQIRKKNFISKDHEYIFCLNLQKTFFDDKHQLAVIM